MKTTKLTANARRFAEACLMNTLNELKEALNSAPDETDMRGWNLSETEWESAVRAAISEMQAE